MREGLRSSSRLLANSPAKIGADRSIGEGRNPSLSDGKVTKLIKSPKEEETPVDQRDGWNSKHEECNVGSGIGEDKQAVECGNRRRKRSRVDGKEDSGDDNSVKKHKLKLEDDDKPQVVCRVLRSMSAAKSQVKDNSKRRQSNGGCIAERTRGKAGSEEKKVVDVEKQESARFNGEHSCQLDNVVDTKSLHGRRRPLKSQESDEIQKELASIEKGEIDESFGHERSTSASKSQIKDNSGRGQSNVGFIAERTRGKVGSEEKKVVNVEKQESDCFNGQHSCQLDFVVDTKSLPGRGRPLKSQESDEIQKELGSIEEGEFGESSGHERSMSAAKSQVKDSSERGQSNGGFIAERTRGKVGSEEKKVVDVEKQESDRFNGEHSCQLDYVVDTKSLPGCGRPLKSQESDEIQKELGGIEEGEIGESSGHEQSMSAAKSQVKDNSERGQSNGGFIAERTRGKVGSEQKKVVEVEKQESACFNGEHSRQLANVLDAKSLHGRGRPPKSQESDENQKELGSIEKGEIGESSGHEWSMSAAKSQVKDNSEREQCNGDFIAERTRGKFGSEEKVAEAEKQASDCFNGEHSCQLDNVVDTKSLHGRRRPPKSQESDEIQKELGSIEKGEIDESSDHESSQLNDKPSEDIKHKRGRPPKSEGCHEFQKESDSIEKGDTNEPSGEESHQFNEKLSKEIKLKRGRPPRSQEVDEFQNELGSIIKGETDDPSGHESHQLNEQLSKEMKRKCGRPSKSQESDEFQKKWPDVEKREIDQSVGEESHQGNNKVSKRIKRKRGRPPKAQQNNELEKKMGDAEDLSASHGSHQPNYEHIELKPRRGRPPKVQKRHLSKKVKAEVDEQASGWPAGEESDQQDNDMGKTLKHNLGRPRKMNKGKKVGVLRKKKKGKTSEQILNCNLGKKNSLSGRKLPGGDHNMKLPQAEKIKGLNNKKKVENPELRAGELGHSRSERQAVRDKIVALLLDAGWEVQYRPRNGRAYMDAVYVNPEGRTHWSITLAYRVLKKHYEENGGDPSTHNSGFKFTPIPDEEMNILTKVIVKERSDKNKKKKKWNKGDEGEKIFGSAKKKKWKLHKRKLGAASGVSHKMLKGRKKQKTMHNQDDSATLGKGTTVSVRGYKRLETHNRKRCSLMVRKSQDGIESEKDGYVLYNGKRTVLAWMIDLGTVPLDGKVQYLKRRKARAVLKGSITKDGIQCDCCSKTFTSAEFETHGGGKSCQPLKNIYLETGLSLLQCQLDSWLKEDESAHKGFHFVDIDGEDPNDDTCGICGDGGDLICCDSCPSTFHQNCLKIRKFPSGLWHCMYCLCKFCGMVGGNAGQRDDDEADPSGALFTCRLCEAKYHQSCVEEDTINTDSSSPSFCGKKCQELYERLQMLFGVKHELEEGFSWTFVRRFDVGSDISLNGMHSKVDCNSKVAVALQIMDECFLPMVDHRSGANLIRNIVYSFGSNFNRLNYSGFVTAILEKGDEMIAAASIRIHGNSLAEMPFIGTRYAYRRQGMCSRLLNGIEMALCSLNVEKLVIPAISELTETWTSVFGFKSLEGSDKQILRNVNMLVFPGVDVLQKPMLKHQFIGEKMSLPEGSNLNKELHTMGEMTSTFDETCSAGFDLKGCESGGPCSASILNECAGVKSGSVLDGCLNDTSDITTQNASSRKLVNRSGVLDANMLLSDDSCLNGTVNTKCCDHSDALSDNLDGTKEIVMSPIDDVPEQTADEINDSAQRCPAGASLKGSSRTCVHDASNSNAEPFATGSGAQHPDGYSNEITDIKVQNQSCCDQSGLIFKNSEESPDSLVHDTAEIDSSQSQDLVSGGAKISDQKAVPWEPKITNMSHVGQSTSPVGHQRAQHSLNGYCAALPVEQNLSSTGYDAENGKL